VPVAAPPALQLEPLFVHVPRAGGGTLRQALGLAAPLTTGHRPYHAGRDGDNRLVIGMARNPWDRAISLYEHHRRAHRAMSFADWVAGPMQAVPIAAPCAHFLQGAHYVGRFERLLEHAHVIAYLFGVECPKALPHVHYQERLPCDHYYTPELRNRVGSFYAADVERYGYTYAG